MFEKITIIGCGLIGSSILRNINNNEISKTITVFDKSKDVVETIKKEKGEFLLDDIRSALRKNRIKYSNLKLINEGVSFIASSVPDALTLVNFFPFKTLTSKSLSLLCSPIIIPSYTLN